MGLIISRTPTADQVSRYAHLRLSPQRDHFIAEGIKVVASLLASGLEIESMYLTPEHFEAMHPLIEAHRQAADIHIYLSNKQDMEAIVGYALHQGIMASARIPLEPKLESLIKHAEHPQLFIILDEIADAENMGALYRTALAMNVAAVIIEKKCISPWMRRAVRVSMGAVFSLPTITVTSLPEAIRSLTRSGVVVYAATLGPEATPLWDADLRGDTALVFGSEGFGIKRHIIEASSSEVTLPMPKDVDSLNVAMSQAIFLYEVRRQRRSLSDPQ